ncbi:hypothetical protein LWT81_09270 [Enterobacter hormaechei]|uniref:hypothetical protein n=1 Tax=Enterobacteriaceae TaxID=543 RepID=UPI0001CD28B1|nr:MULTISPECIES: hypothetical protein [Enterobacteriaceae]ELC6398875.1 hypothetical protein [Enterobacter hormaechei]ELC7444308.1 hypothetical protein [Enterobacter hormaechei]MCE1564300.1 hypothetical protein [Enterobacter hormaechei]CBK86245.1 hypothetical protein ENC_27790 [Enterobacter hormaechei]HAV1884366.1 hypothetical protein [Enterobacter hormaechei subsp. xiangfangensis]
MIKDLVNELQNIEHRITSAKKNEAGFSSSDFDQIMEDFSKSRVEFKKADKKDKHYPLIRDLIVRIDGILTSVQEQEELNDSLINENVAESLPPKRL